MLLRRLALLAILASPACVDARTPQNDASVCATEVECVNRYHTAVLRLQGCLRDARKAGYVDPNASPPPECDGMQAEVNRLTAALARFHEHRAQETGEEGGQGFEVPALPSGKAP